MLMIARMAQLVPDDCCDNLAAQASPNGPTLHPVDSAIFYEWHTCQCGQQVKTRFTGSLVAADKKTVVNRTTENVILGRLQVNF
jgi:hypothetical protein